ncbi:DUF2239 family protein [Bordetella genomosp. 9]|uniref:DUF2239 domain-containing protein n=1 Tax=Bordetella genomosp. 9 TaxID=1416803 RepID=A0A1W6YWM8_9BORD|nr:DUF2239 family protein [Bordetella genomosp. 9]ARP85505.1 hypothetical protein CAL13_04215 [Bordetella genomosp. 9]
MPITVQTPCTAFAGHRKLAAGSLADVALAVKAAIERDPSPAGASVLTFDDATGRLIDIDTRGSGGDVLARLAQAYAGPGSDTTVHAPSTHGEPRSATPRGRGRPRLGVVAREVTLLPRHWEWLNEQPGGASVALRKLVEAAMRDRRTGERAMREAAYRFMSAMAGDMPGFEEAARALFAGDAQTMVQCMAAWPEDVRDHALRLAFGAAADFGPAKEIQ